MGLGFKAQILLSENPLSALAMFVAGSLWWPPGGVCWAAFSARVTDLEPDLITQISLSPTGGTCINQIPPENHSGQQCAEGQLCVRGDQRGAGAAEASGRGGSCSGDTPGGK